MIPEAEPVTVSGQGGLLSAAERPSFVWKHIVCFQETNLVGNVYFAHFASWQGRCREMFLKEHAPDILDRLARDLKLVTVSLSIDYAVELFAFDDIEVHMRLVALSGHRIEMGFEYRVVRNGASISAAQGRQVVACLVGDRPVPVPPSLEAALRRWS
jgi:enediyne biosynthesis thioesterase